VLTATNANRLLLDGALVLAIAEQTGIRIDMDRAMSIGRHLDRQIQRKEERLLTGTELGKAWLGLFKKVNTSSDHQLIKVANLLGMSSDRKTVKGNQSVNAEVLLDSNIDGAAELVRLRKLRKVRGTYLKNIEREVVRHVDGDWYLHPFFHLNTVRTYRSSSSSPNFQNIPHRDPEIKGMIRPLFVPRRGRCLLEVDFKALEVGIAACYHRDPTMIAYLKTDPGAMHSDMARELFRISREVPVTKQVRYVAKNRFVFPEFYGSWYGECARTLWAAVPSLEIGGVPMGEHLKQKGISSFQAFERHVERIERVLWDKRFPVYRDWKEQWWRKYLQTGFFDTLTGFRCSGEMRRNEVINYPVQGSAFHCLLKVLIQAIPLLAKEENRRISFVGQIHDSALFDLPLEEVSRWFSIMNETASKWLPRVWDWIIVPMALDGERSEMDGSWNEMCAVEEGKA